MRILPSVAPTSEQLAIMADNKAGFYLIRGAAGSGKTTTALLRLQTLSAAWLNRRQRLGITEPVRVLVVTYNRTLEGYVDELARQQVPTDPALDLQVRTFGKWATELLSEVNILDPVTARKMLGRLAAGLPGDREFLIDEVDYLLGRFAPDDLDSYLTARRDGRGTSPRVERPLRRRLLDQVVAPYTTEKARLGVLDWNDIALTASAAQGSPPVDVLVVDEAQDFSANQIRALTAHLSPDFSATFVMDAVQRIYPRAFTWREAGISPFRKTFMLRRNHRNTREIAEFAAALVADLPAEDDGAIPDFSACSSTGQLPVVLEGPYSGQVDYLIDYMIKMPAGESVGILQPKGGRWFDYLRARLRSAGIDFVELTRASTWPTGPESVALCTLHSAKGLEFDHVFIPGLNQQVTPHGTGPGDTQLEALRRLVAMGVGRAKKSVVMGYKPDDASTVLDLLKPGTFNLEIL